MENDKEKDFFQIDQSKFVTISLKIYLTFYKYVSKFIIYRSIIIYLFLIHRYTDCKPLQITEKMTIKN